MKLSIIDHYSGTASKCVSEEHWKQVRELAEKMRRHLYSIRIDRYIELLRIRCSVNSVGQLELVIDHVIKADCNGTAVSKEVHVEVTVYFDENAEARAVKEYRQIVGGAFRVIAEGLLSLGRQLDDASSESAKD